MTSQDLYKEKFATRHIGPNEAEQAEMVSLIGAKSVDDLINQTVPNEIRLKNDLNITRALTEPELLSKLKKLGAKNTKSPEGEIYKSYIGTGYYNTHTPGVILRNIFENPGWYTQYTPYQAEISQGRLEALLNFQTVITELTGMEIANASLLDEGTAAAEAMALLYRSRTKDQIANDADTFCISDNCFPQTIEVVRGRAEALGLKVEIGEVNGLNPSDKCFGVLLQYPGQDGLIQDIEPVIKSFKSKNIGVAVAADILSLTLLKSPGEMGADVAVGSAQRFGIPIGFGGPHPAFFATKTEHQRKIPGRIIGISKDRHGNPAYRMALQTREQHIRREKATSNICTAQALLAIMAGAYATYHGPKNLKSIATRVNRLTQTLNAALQSLGLNQTNTSFFDTLAIKVETPDQIVKVKKEAISQGINFRYSLIGHIGISLDETTRLEDVEVIVRVFENALGGSAKVELASNDEIAIPKGLKRTSKFLTHEVFNKYHSETEMLRYLKRLENKDLSLTGAMIPLGSCTMKLNASVQMMPLSWPEFATIHPFVPEDQSIGYREIFRELEQDLAEITGLDAVSLQPNSGAQGELAGLMVIRSYHEGKGQGNRKAVLIPSSAHGTNPASAVMAGLKVVIVACLKDGDVDVEDLKVKIEKHKDDLAGLMITYPSTHGVFETTIQNICNLVHEAGGLVYMDGANMNAQVGLTNPGSIGADICHLNLHKTFAIPHGGGGPGMGPICVTKELEPFLPGHPLVDLGHSNALPPVSAAPWGSGSILLISYAYIKLLGTKGLTNATKGAILNANYIKSRLEKHYSVLFTGDNGRVAHELILDLKMFKKTANITIEDVAKRLIDYGFHAPTMAWPVADTMMVEPTESEGKAELDRFCDAMIQIREEIAEIESNGDKTEDNPLKNAPHTIGEIASDNWDHAYSRQKAAFPQGESAKTYWTPVARIDGAYGDRNLVCTCIPLEAYEDDREEKESNPKKSQPKEFANSIKEKS